MTLAEHDALLKVEGRYERMIERQRQQEEERQKRAAEWRRAEAPLVEDLRTAGFAVESAWDLVNTATSYPKALPILLNHLPIRIRDQCAKALRGPWQFRRRSSAGTF